MTSRPYSLWLMPAGIIQQEFSQMIARLAKAHSSVEFQPHITLLGNVEAREEDMVTKTQEVASLIYTYPVKMVDIGYTDYYYRALYLNVQPSSEVITAYQMARKVFPDASATAYTPHLSLLYGGFPLEVKGQIIRQIGDNFSHEFVVNALYLYLTEGATNEWREIGVFPLQNVRG